MVKLKKSKAAILTTLSVLTISVCGGCGLIPSEEEDHKINIVTEDVSNSYKLGLVELHDVSSSITLQRCVYSQIREQNLSFEGYGRNIGNIYVSEGDDVEEGQLLAELDISDLENAIAEDNNLITENTLLISQAQEMIDFYTGRIDNPSTGMYKKEEYILSRENYNEKLILYKSQIEEATADIAKKQESIEECRIYAPFTGTISKFADSLSKDWYAVRGGITVMTIIDGGQCAFKALDRIGAESLAVGQSVDVVTSAGNSYYTTITSINPETCEIVLELDEPDYSLSVGTTGKATITVEEKKSVPALPVGCVFSTDEYDYVYVLSENGVREMKKITLGIIGDKYAEITSGLELHETVIEKSK